MREIGRRSEIESRDTEDAGKRERGQTRTLKIAGCGTRCRLIGHIKITSSISADFQLFLCIQVDVCVSRGGIRVDGGVTQI